jgi:hypothetical protein
VTGLSGSSAGAVAFTAIDRLALSGLERDLAFLAALGTNRGVQLARRWIARATFSAGRAPLLATIQTALGLVRVALGSKELLLPAGKREWITALDTCDLLVLVGHWMRSSVIVLWSVEVIQHLGIDLARLVSTDKYPVT